MHRGLTARGGSWTEPFGADSGRMQGSAKRRILDVFKWAATEQPARNLPGRRHGDFHHGLVALSVAAMAAVSCSNATVVNPGQGGSSGQGGSGGKGGNTPGGGAGGGITINTSVPDANLSADRPGGGTCGDGIIERNEDCDDGNTASGDGCSRICQVESNWNCPKAGQPCENLAKCGNSILTSDETCDDSNTVSGDGCSADCKTVEAGFQCRVPGKPCTPKCGDSIISGSETCDDGNTKSGDGCSATCHLEIGFKCGEPGTACTKTTCGDSKKEGGEGCDDGNTVPFDGCSEDCQIEPDCTGTSGCTSECGDGIVLGEGCDDGNAASGDGCSSGCKQEPGWTCTQPDIGNKMMVPIIYRDFKFSKDVASPGNDFENGVSGSYAPLTGMVNATLNNKGKPVYSGIGGNAHVLSADSFGTWYVSTDGVNHPTASKMTLWNDGKGNYVNRYGANGEQWNTTAPANWCGTVADAMLDASGNPIPCTFKYQKSDANPTGSETDCLKMEAQGYVQLPGSCKADSGGTYKAQYIVSKADGNPLFFPVDGDSFSPASELKPAKIAPYYDASASWPFDTDAAGNNRLHNFSFTSEVRYWFLYDKSKTYTLDFVGDDDVWVFINRKLAVDLGGVHTPIDGNIVIGADGNGKTTITQTYPIPAPASIQQSAALGLQNAQVYEIAVFQAERQTDGSSYKLTLSGFNAAPTSCVPTCGDGVTVADEECDCGKDTSNFPKSCPGPNQDDAYGGCTTKCTWGGYCGDGLVNGPDEECDDGKDNGTKNGKGGCTLGCTKQHYCGDGIPDTNRDEVCDLGDRNGQTLDSQLAPSTDPTAQIYCTATCTIPPGIVY
jgi:fibro-slime domain-containing protein